MASDVISKKDKYYKLVTFGYCRGIEESLKINIPIIFKTIVSKYCKKYIIIGIGSNNGSFSIGKILICNFTNWIKLSELENITSSVGNIHPNSKSLMVIDERNRLYVAGNNAYNKLIETKEAWGTIYNFMQVKFSNNDADDANNKFLLSSHGCNLCHAFIYLLNDSLYANGNNVDGQFGNQVKDETDEAYHTLTLIPRFWPKLEQLKQILCCGGCTLFLTSKNKLYFCGKMDGLPDVIKPKLIDDNICQISVGDGYYMSLNDSGLLKICGKTNNMDKEKIMNFFNGNSKIRIQNICCGDKHGVIITKK